jgi:sugar phosphate isomerase/epimerase
VARVGLMLYSVREECARDLEATLHEVAATGYEGVELFDLHGHEAGRVRAWLDEAGLEAAGRHVPLEVLEGRLDELAADARALGTPRAVLSWVEPPRTIEQADALAARLGRVAEEAADRGLELGFHNHDGELKALADGRSFLDRLLDQPLFLELDLGWAWWAGADPVALLERTRGRVPLVHLKDFRRRGERSFCPVGDGGVGYDRVAPAAEAAGVAWLIVEQDEAQGSALDAARRSYAALQGTLEHA